MRSENGMVSVLLGLRLAVAGGREGLARLALTAFGVALGVMFVLSALAGANAMDGRDGRSAWQDSEAMTSATAPDAALWLAVTDHYQGRAVVRVHVAPLGPRPPVPPGLDRLPAPGEVAVSPALRQLLATTSPDQLGNRFPGRVTTTIGDEGVRHPDHLVAVIGHTTENLQQLGGAQVVRGIATGSLDLLPIMEFVLTVAAIVVMIPIGVFIVMVARIAAVRREQRLLALRMVGATRMQVGVMAAAETVPAAVLGSLGGLLGYLAVRPLWADIRYGDYQGGPFYVADLTVPAYQVAAIMIAVPALAVGAAVFAFRGLRITPQSPGSGASVRPPSAWRILPVLVGVIGLGVSAIVLRAEPELAGRPLIGSVINLFVLATLVGAVVSGPWVCLKAGRAMARYGRKVTTLMAARRIISAPQASYRAVGGVTLAVYIATLLAGTASIASEADSGESVGYDARQRPGVVEIYAGGVPDATLAPLMTNGTVVIRAQRKWEQGPAAVKCTELARVVDVRCPFAPDLETTHFPSSAAMGLWDTGGSVAEPGPGASRMPIYALYVPTDGSAATVERLRTRVATILPRAIVSTRDDAFRQQSDIAGAVRDMSAAIGLVTLFVIVVAGCSLTISVANGLMERRRPFALLRASGLRLGELRRITMLETAVPLLLTVALGIVLGSVPMVAASMAEGISFPGVEPAFAGLLGGVVLASLAITTLAFPLMNAATRYDSVRYE